MFDDLSLAKLDRKTGSKSILEPVLFGNLHYYTTNT